MNKHVQKVYRLEAFVLTIVSFFNTVLLYSLGLKAYLQYAVSTMLTVSYALFNDVYIF